MKRGESGIAVTLGLNMEINEEIKQKMVEYLQSFEAGMKKAGEFSAEQAPLVVQEFLAWEFWGAVFIAAGFLFMAVILTIILIVVYCRRTDEFERFMIGVFGGAPVLALYIASGIATHDALKVTIAPRVVVLEKISELVK